MPNRFIRQKVVQSKTSKKWFLVTETIEQVWTALNYIEAMKKGTLDKVEQKLKAPKEEWVP